MLRKWIVYMLILAFAAGTQLFVEPQLVSQASFGIVAERLVAQPARLPVRLQAGDFNGAAALASVCCSSAWRPRQSSSSAAGSSKGE